MIVDAIVGVLMAILNGVLGLMPAYQLPASFGSFGTTIGDKLAGVNGVFPVVTLGQALAAMVSWWVFKAVWILVVWIYDKFPFKAT